MGKEKQEWKHVTIFDRQYPMEKQAEGMAVHQAVVTGACDECCFLPRCSTDDNFSPPVFAWCYRKKKEILAAWKRRADKKRSFL